MTAGVDVEALVANAIRDEAGVAALVSDRIYVGNIPEKPTYPFGRLFRLGGPTDFLGHLDHARVQFEAFARDRVTALDLAREMLGAALPLVGSFDEGVVTGVAPFIGITYLPDPPTGYPRYIFDLVIHCHPIPA